MPQPTQFPDVDVAVDVMRSSPELVEVRERTTHRTSLELSLTELFRDRDSWILPVICVPCGETVRFQGDWNFSYGDTINFRERLVCPHCKLNSRKRFAAHLLEASVKAEELAGPVYMFEQVSPFFEWAQAELPFSVIGSEYLGIDMESGTTIDGLRHEDALALSFEDVTRRRRLERRLRARPGHRQVPGRMLPRPATRGPALLLDPFPGHGDNRAEGRRT
jgi:hypothetical protein